MLKDVKPEITRTLKIKQDTLNHKQLRNYVHGNVA